MISAQIVLTVGEKSCIIEMKLYREAFMAEFDLNERTRELISLCGDICKAGGSIVVTGHDSPDADSVISAVMMKRFLEKYNIVNI